jgi:hypothetical protein
MRKRLLLVGMLWFSLVATRSTAAVPGCDRKPKVQVTCSRSSPLIDLNVTSCRKIGNVVIEVRDASGKSLYREEGKAMTPQLIRRLDKGTFPKGDLVVSVTTHEFRVDQPFTVE